LNELSDLAFDLHQFTAGMRCAGSPGHPQAIHLARVLLAELLEQVLAHQLLTERIEHPLLDFAACDCPSVAAGAARSRVEACERFSPQNDVPAAADTAFRQAGEEVLRPPKAVELLPCNDRCNVTNGPLPSLHTTPQVVVDDAQ